MQYLAKAFTMHFVRMVVVTQSVKNRTRRPIECLVNDWYRLSFFFSLEHQEFTYTTYTHSHTHRQTYNWMDKIKVPSVMFCFHSTLLLFLLSFEEAGLFNKWATLHLLLKEQVFHSSSYLRVECCWWQLFFD